MDIVKESLSRSYLFAGIKSDDLELLAKEFKLRDFNLGDVLINESDEGEAIYLIADGSVRVEVQSSDLKGSEEIARLKQYDVVGEFILAKSGRRSATVTAVAPLKVCESNRESLVKLFDQHPRIGYAVYKSLSEILVDRIKGTNMTARNALGLVVRMY